MSEYKKGNEGAFAKEFQSGLTKREYFAAMAMQGFCANAESYANCQFDEVAEMAILQADALIEELNKESK